RIADERVTPGLAGGRASPHVTPIRVVVPDPSVAVWLDSRPEAPGRIGTIACADQWIGAGRMVPSKSADAMMQFPAIEGELDVEPEKKSIESLLIRRIQHTAKERRPGPFLSVHQQR